jgi:hypothetical protein
LQSVGHDCWLEFWMGVKLPSPRNFQKVMGSIGGSLAWPHRAQPNELTYNPVSLELRVSAEWPPVRQDDLGHVAGVPLSLSALEI